MSVRRLPDGSRFYGKADVDELPDYDLPCPQCGQPWESHEDKGNVRIVKLKRTGEAGFVMPACLETCSCCHRKVRLQTTMSVGPVVVFCEDCRPSDDVLENWDQRVALIDGLTGQDPPPCPHGL